MKLKAGVLGAGHLGKNTSSVIGLKSEKIRIGGLLR